MAAAKERSQKRRGGSSGREGAKILPFRRETTFNVGLIIFIFIFLYLAYSLIHGLTRESYSSFSVGKEEQLNASRSYHALILRSEEMIQSHWAGYVDFLAPEGSHVSVGSPVSSVDELGSYSESIRQAADLNNLTREELLSLKDRLRSLSLNYDGSSFNRIYEERSGISAFFMSHLGSASLAVLEQNASLNEFFHVHKSDTSGLVLYYYDGYEKKEPRELTAADFTGKNYERHSTENLVTVGDFLYKRVDSETWRLLLPVDAQEAAQYGATGSVSFTFLKNGLQAKAPCRVLNGADGSFLLELTLSRYMVQFASDRFTEIRIDDEGPAGYKIPASCAVNETVYLIPRSYEISGNSGSGTFLQEVYSGTVKSAQSISAAVYYRDEDYCYASMDAFSPEAVLILPDSQERYTVRLTTVMLGVYQINAGYTVFCPIEVLDQTGEYMLVKKGTQNGVSTYDSLLLNASGYSAGQILR